MKSQSWAVVAVAAGLCFAPSSWAQNLVYTYGNPVSYSVSGYTVQPQANCSVAYVATQTYGVPVSYATVSYPTQQVYAAPASYSTIGYPAQQVYATPAAYAVAGYNVPQVYSLPVAYQWTAGGAVVVYR
jgi:hypothetical protein